VRTRVVATRCSQEMCGGHVASPLALNSGVATAFHRIQSAIAAPGAGPRHQWHGNGSMLRQVSSARFHLLTRRVQSSSAWAHSADQAAGQHMLLVQLDAHPVAPCCLSRT
jgi:hypothetical protein